MQAEEVSGTTNGVLTGKRFTPATLLRRRRRSPPNDQSGPTRGSYVAGAPQAADRGSPMFCRGGPSSRLAKCGHHTRGGREARSGLSHPLGAGGRTKHWLAPFASIKEAERSAAACLTGLVSASLLFLPSLASGHPGSLQGRPRITAARRAVPCLEHRSLVSWHSPLGMAFY